MVPRKKCSNRGSYSINSCVPGCIWIRELCKCWCACQPGMGITLSGFCTDHPLLACPPPDIEMPTSPVTKMMTETPVLQTRSGRSVHGIRHPPSVSKVTQTVCFAEKLNKPPAPHAAPGAAQHVSLYQDNSNAQQICSGRVKATPNASQ